MVTSRHCVVAVMELLLYFPSKQSKKRLVALLVVTFPEITLIRVRYLLPTCFGGDIGPFHLDSNKNPKTKVIAVTRSL